MFHVLVLHGIFWLQDHAQWRDADAVFIFLSRREHLHPVGDHRPTTQKTHTEEAGDQVHGDVSPSLFDIHTYMKGSGYRNVLRSSGK